MTARGDIPKYVRLLTIIGEQAANHPYYGVESYFHVWEDTVAFPMLEKAGYKLHAKAFFNIKDDMFGPLARGTYVERDGVVYIVWYGD